MEKLLNQLGLVTSTGRIYDFLKNFLRRNAEASFSELIDAMTAFLDVHNAENKARKILVFLREQKLLWLQDGKIYASKKIRNFVNKKREEYTVRSLMPAFRRKPIILKESGVIVEQGGNRYKLYDDGRIGMFV